MPLTPTTLPSPPCDTSMLLAQTRDGRVGQSTLGATHLIKVACETAMGKRSEMNIFGNDYPTHRRYVHSRLYSR